MRGIAHVLHTLASIGLMTDPGDIGHTLGSKSEPDGLPGKGTGGGGDPGFDPTIFLYDRIPGGIGLAPRLFAARDELLRRARATIEGCACDEGCPACVGAVVQAPAALTFAKRRELSRRPVALALLTDLAVTGTH
jgi:DEAD/DEAH box helicase domain-containing protein